MPSCELQALPVMDVPKAAAMSTGERSRVRRVLRSARVGGMPDIATTPSLLLSIATTQNGILTRKQAREAGCAESELGRWIRKGHLRTLWRGILTFLPEPDDDAGRHRELALAVATVYGDRVVVSHHSALVVAGLPTYGVNLDVVRLTRLNKGDSLLSPPVRISRSSVQLATYEVAGARVVTTATALAQVGAECGIEACVVAADAALHRGLVTTGELTQAIEGLGRGANLGRARQAVALTDGLSESPGESLLRLIATKAGVGLTPQFEVTDQAGRFVGRADFRVDGTTTLVEFDGKVKYADQDALFAEKRREDSLRALGWEVIRFVWADLAAPRSVVARLKGAAAKPKEGLAFARGD